MAMDIKDYFAKKDGFGVLSTADGHGRVNSAVFARPMAFDNGTLAFIMADRLCHEQLRENPHATYLFREQGPHYEGKRLSLVKTGEEGDGDRIEGLLRQYHPERAGSYAGATKFLVFFRVEHVRPLVGERG